MDGLIDTLRKRGLIEAETNPDIGTIIESKKPVRLYCGFDPTADSLHIGHMVAIMGLAWFRRYGHTPVVLVGGATGLIGDPSGKSQERNLLSHEDLTHNVSCIHKILQTILSRVDGTEEMLMVNNADWFGNMSFIDFLRDVGRYFRVGIMLSRESVRTRLASEEGLSYTEFSYQLLQSYDFFHLFKNHNVTVQLGGADQWGNIVAGIDFVRRLTNQEVYGLTWPLLLKSDGKKFGKSEKGAVWLSESKLSVFDFYQYLFRTSDDDVIRLLKALTFVDLEEISALERDMKKPGYVPNTAQRLLAEEVTRLVHGEEGLQRALKTTEQALPGQEEVEFTASIIHEMKNHLPSKALPKVSVVGVRICDVLANALFVPSKADARRLIKNGGLVVNNRKITDEFDVVAETDLIAAQYVVFSLGKKNRVVLEVT